ncbi:PorT family protein [Hymenobacter sp. HSC-4F20]|uniref:porin family protein n=1 Tax=Hymenobacter sp. HSC-4F20 TaxID=2864135 RepID=UPI001C72EC90|nr:porin family protein [Hymenobacter sp. HSC-4F20]MBX0292853.1 PorT family protein [Hymenobacter sp. HSC-4F20]
MKKLSFSLLLVAGLTGLARAQSVQAGLKAGANLATITGDDADNNNKYKVGLNAGVALQVGLAPKNFIALQPEILYSMKGARSENGAAEATSTLHYLEVPVLLRINADGPFFELGPQVGFLLAVKNELKSGSASVSSTSKDLYHTVDLGGVAGIGYQFSSGPSIGVRYNMGFAPLYKDILGTTIKQYNSAFQFQLGYRIGR